VPFVLKVLAGEEGEAAQLQFRRASGHGVGEATLANPVPGTLALCGGCCPGGPKSLCFLLLRSQEGGDGEICWPSLVLRLEG
jgi:hypothetical protein